MKVTIRPETPQDKEAIRQVHYDAFDREAEAKLVEDLRDGGHARLSLVAEANKQVIGHAMFSAVQIMTDAGPMQALALGPVAVLSELQRKGIGSALIKDGLYLCAQRHHRVVLLLGDPNFYGRFGFSADLTRSLKCRFAGEDFMALELVQGALNGVEGLVMYPPPFSGSDTILSARRTRQATVTDSSR